MDTNQLLMNPKVKAGVVVVSSALVLFVTYFIFHFLSVGMVMGKVRTSLEAGFPAVAANDIERYRTDIVRRKDGCRLLLDTYFAARKPDGLEWASQACMASGQESPEAFLALAVSQELKGSDSDALRVLDAGIKKFEKTPGLYLKVAQIFRRNKSVDEAANFYTTAVEKGPDNQNTILEALQFFVENGKNDPARLMATRIRTAKTDNPEVKLLIARALKRGGDADGAKVVADEAQVLMASNAPLKARLEKAYSDVFEIGNAKGKSSSRLPSSKN
jgi:predicted Zn-dependent protease